MVDLELAEELDLLEYKKHLENIENQYMNIIYNPLLDEIQERWMYEKTYSLIDWTCAICGSDILIDKNRNDIENFVCEKCCKKYNNNNLIVDRRILKSRNRLYKWIEDRLYEELEDRLKGGGI